MSLVSHVCLSVMSSISIFERVKSALNSNDVETLRTIYDGLACRLRSRRVVSIEEHSKAIALRIDDVSVHVCPHLHLFLHSQQWKMVI